MGVKGRVLQGLTYDTVLQRTDEYDIYRYYLGIDFKIGKPILSPFRKDNNPSFWVHLTKNGTLKHMDFGDAALNGNCIEFVQQLYGLNFNEALKRVDSDLGLGILKDSTSPGGTRREKREREQEPEKLYHVVTRRFNRRELDYWAQYYITEQELKDNDVYAVKEYYVDRKRAPMREGLMFAYWFDPKWKFYLPGALDKRRKFFGNVSYDTISGLHKMVPGCKMGIVTKAKKDEILLSKFLPNVCSVQGESIISINSSNISLLNSNCGSIYLNFDSDEVGVQTCKYYNQFGFRWINCPKEYKKPNGDIIKDFSDLAMYHGLDTVIRYFKEKGLV